MAKVYAPLQDYNGISASVEFVNGVGETDNENLLEWFEEKGYTVERDEKPKRAKKAKEVTEETSEETSEGATEEVTEEVAEEVAEGNE
ncbi:hypothetical protein [Veillonella sp. 3310]|uniref:hypothetical protein n=1 Tax=Veillonella sp. 3310 TaxID=2490956 RepID=UPI000FD69402|nr:hypothetical protein [Veillonella sp. 3310]